MSQINPFTGAIVQAPQVQRTQAAEKDRQLRRVQELTKNAAVQGDQLQHEVESSEPISPVRDEDAHQNPSKRRKRPLQADDDSQSRGDDDAGESHIDVTA